MNNNQGWNPMDRIIQFDNETTENTKHTQTEAFLCALFIAMMVVVSVVYTTPFENLASLIKSMG